MKQYGIRITLPQNSTLSGEHLLGGTWESFRWYDTEAAREMALAEMARPLPNYRKGDHPATVLERVERSA